MGLAEGPGVDEAIAVLRQVRGTMLEATAVQWALRGVGTRTIPDPVRVAGRGHPGVARRRSGRAADLEGISSTPGLILAADLYAGSGQLARAVGTIERVLARDLDAPGARERHQRWSLSLGYTRRPARHLDEATVVAAAGDGRPLPPPPPEVARGGAGAVYEAEDDLLGRRIAFRSTTAGEGPGPCSSARPGPRVALAGPGVLRVLDADPAQGWVALEWVARGSIRDMLRTGDLASLVPHRALGPPLARASPASTPPAWPTPTSSLPTSCFASPRSGAGRLRHRPPPPAPRARAVAAPATSPPSASPAAPPTLGTDIYGTAASSRTVLHRLGEAGFEPATTTTGDTAMPQGGDFAVFRALAEVCIGPDEERPRTAPRWVRRPALSAPSATPP